ncbi:MAG: bifunctional demethylmenaquinone methyltransferase/2-methoxy-6-polyprenyl-1,4-benzoquinol methylase UbiE [Phycisphaerales bacterium]
MSASAAQPGEPAWSASELADPHHHAAKHDKVQRMFAAIAGSYDLNNRVHSFWRDQAWRRAAVRAAGLRGAERVLDCACGTGDLTEAFARGSRGPGRAMVVPASVVGLDFTAEMLAIAERKRAGLGSAAAGVRYVQGDAQNLPFEPSSFDVVSIAFGIRNVADPARAIAEFYRVLAPGGRLVVLEFDRPRIPIIGAVSEFYTSRIMPLTATLISKDRSGAYRYLPKSVEKFMNRDELKSALARAGFVDVHQRALTFGVCVCSVGVKPV